LSELAKVAYLQEKIKEVQSSAGIFGVGSFLCLMLAVVGFVFYFRPPPYGGLGLFLWELLE
jgi:hypothetical protein